MASRLHVMHLHFLLDYKSFLKVYNYLLPLVCNGPLLGFISFNLQLYDLDLWPKQFAKGFEKG